MHPLLILAIVGVFLMLSPTIAYLAFAPAVFAFLDHDTPERAVIGKCLYVGLPLLSWCFSRLRWERRSRAFQAEVDAVPRGMLTGPVPTDLVVEGGGWAEVQNMNEVAGVERLFEADGAENPVEWKLFRLPLRTTFVERERVTELPNRYLLLRMGRRSKFRSMSKLSPVGGGPFELSLVEGDRETLLGLEFETPDPKPCILPVFTLSGWLKGRRSRSTDQIRRDVERFVASTLETQRAATPGDLS